LGDRGCSGDCGSLEDLTLGWFTLRFFAGLLGRFFERFLKPATSGGQKNNNRFLRCERSSRAAFTSLFGHFLPLGS
jgi:hypothetical protein